MRKLSQKALSIVMSIVLVVGLCPGLAYAGEGGEGKAAVSDALVAAASEDLSAQVDLGAQAEMTAQASAISGGAWLKVTSSNCNAFDSITFNGKTVNAIYPVGYKPSGSDPTYCCAAFVKKFYKTIWGVDVWNLIYPRVPIAGSGSFSLTLNPVVGDIVATTDHWGIVKSVNGNTVTVIEQNWSSMGSGGLWAGRNRTCKKNNSSTTKFYHWSGYRTVNPTPTAKAPTIVPTDILGGKSIEIRNNESGASMRYTTDGATNPSNSVGTVYSGKFYDSWAVMGVRAIAYKSGYNNSSVTGMTLRNGQTAAPTLEKVDMPNGGAIVLDAPGSGETIYYTTDGSNPSFNVSTQQATGTKYTGSFTLTQNATVKAIAVRSGERVSEMLTKEAEVVPPAAPATVVVLNGTVPASKIAVDDAVTVRWAEDPSASSYVATLYDEGGEVVEASTVKAAQAVFTPSRPGKYSVGVKAVNSVGASEESERDNFEAMAPCLVNFVDKTTDSAGNVTTKILDKQLVRYGYSAENPAVPVKRGYTFAGWDKDTPLTHITENGYEIIATWQINSYTVRFYKDDGKTLITSQSVNYGSAATPPTPPAAESGYVFTGWAVTEAAEDDSARDYTNVDSNMSLKAVYAWADQELPVVVSINSAKRNDRVYTVDVNVKNNPTTATTAILRVSLKTSTGKLVQSARETISLPAAGATTNHVVSLRYEDDGYIATKAEVEVVGFSGDNRTGGAYSKAATATVVNEQDFELATSASEWTTVRPAESDDYVIESETQYRYQDKLTTTSTSSSLEGWTREGDPVTTYGAWSGNQTTTSRPTASDTLSIKSTSTRYNWYHWCSYYDNCWNHDSCWVNSSSVKHTTSTTSDLAYANKSWGDKGGKASSMRGPYSSCAHHTSGHTYWWLESTVTTYTYQTRSKTVTYGYYKWSDWSDWSSEEATSSDTRNVEERTVYRTRAKLYSELQGTEDTSGETYTISGSFDSSLQVAGKEATIMVYNVTNTDPNEDQIQFIGQTTIGADNSYSFSFIPKKEPSAETGDFIVSLGVKGSTGLVNVDKIDAPGAEHTVVYLYKNADGEEVKVSEQTVADGQSAVVPDPPAVEGSQFQRWSASTTSVTSDMTVNALYTTATYAVAWVDWVNGGVFLETKAYGDALAAPVEDPSANGYTFKGWDALLDGRTTVTGNTVVNAVYDPVKYSVIFADSNNGVFAKQEVAYGEAANPPAEGPEAEGMVFVSWDTSAGTPWWNVTEDMIVRPKYAYEETASSPYPTVEIDEGFTGVFGKKLQLESSTDGSTIFYKVEKKSAMGASSLTAQGSDEAIEEPEEEWFEYDPDSGIVVTEPVVITAVAAKAGMNDSTPYSMDVNVTATNDIANAEAGVAEAPFFYGEPVEPGVMVWIGDDLLTYGEDYTVEYSNNKALGTGRALVRGKGSYTGTQLVLFDIVEPAGDDVAEQSEKTDISKAKVTASPASQTYTGAALLPSSVTVTLDGKALVAGTDYTVAYSNNTAVGTANVTVTGAGNYTGVAHGTFVIVAPEESKEPKEPEESKESKEPEKSKESEGSEESKGSEAPEASARKAAGVERLQGSVALDTMAAIVSAGNYDAGGTVVLTTIDGYWDALTAAGVAGLAAAPVLMTDGGSLSEQTRSVIAGLAPTTVVVCGGTAAVTDSAASQALDAAAPGATLVRMSGSNAVGTACDIYAKAPSVAGGAWSSTAIVATDDGYWDALAAAPLSYALHMPIFLARGHDSVSDEVIDAMRAGGVTEAYIAGGTAALSSSVEEQLSSAGIVVRGRLAGATAVQTSEAVAAFGLSQGMTTNSMGVATNDGYWDALSGAALCGRLNSVLVLAGSASDSSVAEGGFVDSHAAEIDGLYIFGGSAAVDDSIQSALQSQIQ